MNGWTAAAFDRWLTTEPEWHTGDDEVEYETCEATLDDAEDELV